MTPAAPLILITGSVGSYTDALTTWTLRPAPNFATEPVPDGALAWLYCVQDVRTACQQTRRARIELGERILPMIWVLPENFSQSIPEGLAAGADVCLVEPLSHEVLRAQIAAAVRSAQLGRRLGERAAEARGINERLRAAHRELAQLTELGRQAIAAAAPRTIPVVGRLRVGVSSRGPSGIGGPVEATRLDRDRLGLWLADAGGSGTALGGLLAALVRGLIASTLSVERSEFSVSPGDILAFVNRGLCDLKAEPPALVGVAYVIADGRTGSVTLARGGLPPPIWLSAGEEPRFWAEEAGPFLGGFEADYANLQGTLAPGDKLILGTIGDRDRLSPAIAEHRALPAAGLAYTLAQTFETDPTGAAFLVLERV